MLALWIIVGGLASALATPLVVGEAPPEIGLKDLSGEVVTLASLRGEVVVVDFWATWCGPCKLELPKLQDLARQHDGAPLKILAINVDTDTAARDRYINKNKLSLLTLDDSAQEVVSSYEIQKMPTTLVVDKEGKIFSVHYGFTQEVHEQLIREVESILVKQDI